MVHKTEIIKYKVPKLNCTSEMYLVLDVGVLENVLENYI